MPTAGRLNGSHAVNGVHDSTSKNLKKKRAGAGALAGPYRSQVGLVKVGRCGCPRFGRGKWAVGKRAKGQYLHNRHAGSRSIAKMLV